MKADDTTSHTRRDSHEHDRRRLHFTPYLYMRYVTEDDGTRPLPPDVAFWNSVDIDFFPKVNNNAMAGTPITVTATIWNQGYLSAVGVRVDFFWFQPGTVFQDRDSNRINQRLHLETVPAQSCKTVYCPTPWIPTYLGDGHECLERGAYRTLGELEMAPHESRSVRIAIDAIDVEPGTFQVLR